MENHYAETLEWLKNQKFRELFLSTLDFEFGEFVEDPDGELDEYRSSSRAPMFNGHHKVLDEAYLFLKYNEGALALLPNGCIVAIDNEASITPIGSSLANIAYACDDGLVPGVGYGEGQYRKLFVSAYFDGLSVLFGIQQPSRLTESELESMMSDYPGYDV